MSRVVIALLICCVGAVARAQPGPNLVGSLQGNVYTSATGAFRIPSPVSPALGGSIVDTANAVTFADPFSTYVTIVNFPLDPTQKWEMDTATSRKDYLLSFFDQQVLPDFLKAFPKLTVEPTGRYVTTVQNGALLVFMLIPGGSMFAHPEDQIALDEKTRVAKRANLIFVHGGFIYVISTELAERVTEGSAYHHTSDQEDQILRDRLIALVGSMRFTSTPVPAAP
jgi:hypothetical protein